MMLKGPLLSKTHTVIYYNVLLKYRYFVLYMNSYITAFTYQYSINTY
uniref:Uncharacterized protein n=1 Tax=Anguilla anguilla TaxID=7936 RepID=A0A0E9SF77_ANGAN